MVIREFDWPDLKGCLPLMKELGYATDEQTLLVRWQAILKKPDYHLWVAAKQGKILGLIAFHKMDFFEADGSYIRILALVVSSAHRRQGLATKLLDAVSDFAANQNCTALALNSGLSEERSIAHQFYRNYGFLQKSAGFTYQIENT